MNSRTFLLWLGIALHIGCAGSTTDSRLARKLDHVLHSQDDKGVIYTARVIDLESGRSLYEHRIDDPMIPASNMKLFTTAAALAHFGPGHQFETYLVKMCDDLLIIGGGDPATGDDKIAAQRREKPTAVFDRWAQALKQRGIGNVSGRLLYYDGIFDRELVHPNWSKGFATEWYAAPVAGLNFNDNCIDVVAEPTRAGEPARLSIMPPTSMVTIRNETKSAGEGSPAIEREQSEDVFTVKGNVSKRVELQSKPIMDPGAFFADAFRTHLESCGITISGPTQRIETVPTDRRVDLIAVNRSPMVEVINRLNKSSQNLFAEAFAKLLGREYNRRNGSDAPGSWVSGAAATGEFLRSARIDESQFVMIDGSGLSRRNKVTGRMVSDLLIAMHSHPYGQVYRESLPRAGEDGTLAKRMPDLKGHVWAKTGYIGGVRALSGYVKTREGKWLAFCTIFNKIPGSVKPFEQVQDSVCRVLVEYPHVERAQLEPTTQPATQPAAQSVK